MLLNSGEDVSVPSLSYTIDMKLHGASVSLVSMVLVVLPPLHFASTFALHQDLCCWKRPFHGVVRSRPILSTLLPPVVKSY